MILKINNNKNGDNNCHDYDRDNCSLNDSDSGVTILSKIYTFGDTLGVRGGGDKKLPLLRLTNKTIIAQT